MADTIPHVQAVKAEELPTEKPQALGPEQTEKPTTTGTPVAATPEVSTEEPKQAVNDAPVVPAKDEASTSELAPTATTTDHAVKDFANNDAGVAATTPETPLQKLLKDLPAILHDASHNEMWGVNLTDETHVPTTIVLEKFLRANLQDVTKAKVQLTEALKWRKQMEPAKLLDAAYDQSKFGGLGYVTTYNTEAGKEIVTWNVYGAVKDKKATFGNIEEFIKWRCALMEISVKELDLASKTKPIPKDGVDPYRMVQVHDYLSVSFLRQDPAVKAATKETISTFSMAYPELLKEKFFVNVPVLMGWMFTAIKLFLAPETVKKFHPLSYGAALAGELPSIGAQLPEVYGGTNGKLEDKALTPKYTGTPVKEAATAVQST